jgi:predicted PurR-regulated permease PerM
VELYNFGVSVIGEPTADSEAGFVDLNGNGVRDEGYLAAMIAWVEQLAARFEIEAGAEEGWYEQMLRGVREWATAEEGLLAGVLSVVKTTGRELVSVVASIPGLATSAALTAIYLFFFLISFDRMIEWVRRCLPARHKARIEAVASRVDAAISAFLRGRLIVCLCVGALTALGLWIFGVPYWYLIGVATGIAGIVPYLPIFVGLAPAMLAAWFNTGNVWTVVAAVGVFTVVQGLEGWVLTPLIQGRAVGLHPVTLMVALLLGYEMLGLFGMIAAVPLASTVKILAQEFLMPEVEELAHAPGERRT